MLWFAKFYCNQKSLFFCFNNILDSRNSFEPYLKVKIEVCLFSNEIDDLRKKITTIDQQILKLVAERITAVSKIGEVKLKKNLNIKNFLQEATVFERVEQQAKEIGLNPRLARSLYELIIHESVESQVTLLTARENQEVPNAKFNLLDPFYLYLPSKSRLKIGFQGELGAFSHLAILENFPNATPVKSESFSVAVNLLVENEVDCVLLPFNNTTAGKVVGFSEALQDLDLIVVGKLLFFVRHMLIVHHSINSIDEIETIYSHPQALKQCKRYLQKHSHIKTVETFDTAGSVRLIKDKNLKHSAAIGSKIAANVYQMKILDENIQDELNNYTQFALLTDSNKIFRVVKELKR